MKSVLLTSGNSYVGRFLRLFLAKMGYSITFTAKTITKVSQNETFVPFDFLSDPAKLRYTLGNREFDLVINSTGLYCQPGVPDEDVMSVNYNAAKALKLVCEWINPRTLVHLSSISIYGWPLPHKIEDTTPTIPNDSYGESKLKAELETLGSMAQKRINIRLPVVLGKGAHRAWLVQVRDLMMQNRQVNFYGGQGQYYTYTNLKRLGEFIITLDSSKILNNARLNLPIGGNPEYSLEDMLLLMKRRLGSSSDLIEVDPLPMPCICDSSDARSFGYVPPSIEESFSLFLD